MFAETISFGFVQRCLTSAVAVAPKQAEVSGEADDPEPADRTQLEGSGTGKPKQ